MVLTGKLISVYLLAATSLVIMTVKRRRHLQRLILRRTAAKNKVIKTDKYSQLKVKLHVVIQHKKTQDIFQTAFYSNYSKTVSIIDKLVVKNVSAIEK